MDFNKLTRAELSTVFQVAPTTVDEWRSKGCPFVTDNGRDHFNTRHVVDWLASRKAGKVSQAAEIVRKTATSTEATLKRCKLAAEAELAEIHVMQKKGGLSKRYGGHLSRRFRAKAAGGIGLQFRC